jgi:hypothetical protein
MPSPDTGKTMGSQALGRPRLRWLGACGDLKVLKVRNWKEWIGKFGVTCLRKPKPRKSCGADGRRRMVLGVMTLTDSMEHKS